MPTVNQLVKEGKMQYFSELKIGDKFFMRFKNFGFALDNYGPMQELTYEKISKSKAIVINQIGYGNTRMVGNEFSFGPGKPVIIKYEK